MITLDEIKKISFPKHFGLTDEDDDILNMPDRLQRESYNNGISKLVIFLNESEVIKIPLNGTFEYYYEEDEYVFNPFHVEDYCAVEEYIYCEAEGEGIEEFFAKTEYVGQADCGTLIYKSERVLPYYCENTLEMRKKEPSNEAKNSVSMMDTPLPFCWLVKAYDYYGEEKVKHLINFIKEHDLHDFHNDNIGFRKNGAPVILDYSDYCG